MEFLTFVSVIVQKLNIWKVIHKIEERNRHPLIICVPVFSVEACRILCGIRLRRCPMLAKVGISHCPKINTVAITRDLGRLPARRNRILFVQPFGTSSVTSDETEVFPAQFPPAS